jgi:hypothetical protein
MEMILCFYLYLLCSCISPQLPCCDKYSRYSFRIAAATSAYYGALQLSLWQYHQRCWKISTMWIFQLYAHKSYSHRVHQLWLGRYSYCTGEILTAEFFNSVRIGLGAAEPGVKPNLSSRNVRWVYYSYW